MVYAGIYLLFCGSVQTGILMCYLWGMVLVLEGPLFMDYFCVILGVMGYHSHPQGVTVLVAGLSGVQPGSDASRCQAGVRQIWTPQNTQVQPVGCFLFQHLLGLPSH